MADTTAYKYVSNKNEPWDTTQSVVVSRDEKDNVVKEIVLGGDPVELTQEEHDLLSNYVVLRKATDKQVDEADSTEGKPSGPSAPASDSGGAVTLQSSGSARNNR